mmetsp:Transcript_59901/g.195582  ORF Transcript_59901/g.195582 Transcript_59901/m.195582 type:complete len:361 (-) Transcript_59901:686-1768(-)
MFYCHGGRAARHDGARGPRRLRRLCHAALGRAGRHRGRRALRRRRRPCRRQDARARRGGALPRAPRAALGADSGAGRGLFCAAVVELSFGSDGAGQSPRPRLHDARLHWRCPGLGHHHRGYRRRLHRGHLPLDARQSRVVWPPALHERPRRGRLLGLGAGRCGAQLGETQHGWLDGPDGDGVGAFCPAAAPGSGPRCGHGSDHGREGLGGLGWVHRRHVGLGPARALHAVRQRAESRCLQPPGPRAGLSDDVLRPRIPPLRSPLCGDGHTLLLCLPAVPAHHQPLGVRGCRLLLLGIASEDHHSGVFGLHGLCPRSAAGSPGRPGRAELDGLRRSLLRFGALQRGRPTSGSPRALFVARW